MGTLRMAKASIDAVDTRLAIAALAAMPLATVFLDAALTFVHLGEPVPMERPRFTKLPDGRVMAYTSKRSRASVEALRQTFVTALGQRDAFPDTVAAVLLFYRETLQQADGDNLAKAVLDAGTRAHVWRDDSQVTHCTVVVAIDRDHPRTVVAIAPCCGARTKAPLLVGA